MIVFILEYFWANTLSSQQIGQDFAGNFFKIKTLVFSPKLFRHGPADNMSALVYVMALPQLPTKPSPWSILLC